jgi:hypothetical protein
MHIASDYAAFESGNIKAYYGYEYALPASGDDDWDDAPEWGFEVKRDGVSVLRVPFSGLREREKRLDQFETAECLIVGLELFWERGKG